jgi:hypothetical protein
MAKTFSEIKANVGNNVQDTSVPFATIVGNYINNRYFDILRRINWNAIDEDYSFSTVAGTEDYSLPSDFGKEMFVLDSTNGVQLAHITLQELADDYTSELTSQGVPTRYTIIDYISSGARAKKVRLNLVPSSVITVKMPYIIQPVPLSASTDYTIIPCEDIVEIGATADAWRYQRQFAKAKECEGLFEKGIVMLIWDKENQNNQSHQFKVTSYNRDAF